MAIDEAEQSESGQIGVGEESSGSGVGGRTLVEGSDVAVGRYTWEEFMREHGYESEARSYSGGSSLGLESSVGDFDPQQYLGFDSADTGDRMAEAASLAKGLEGIIDERTVNTIDQLEPGEIDGVEADDIEEFDEDDFFTTEHGHTTVVNRYDLEKSVPMEKKTHFREEQRYWVNKPYSFVVIFHSVKENEKKYYAIEPHLNRIETDLREFLSGKLRTAVKYSQDEISVEGDQDERKQVIERETKRLLHRYDLFSKSQRASLVSQITGLFGDGSDPEVDDEPAQLDGISARPEPALLAEDSETLNEYQVEKLLYLLKRDFIGYERIDPIKHDINVEDISCDGWNTRVFVYHTDYEQIISNIEHGKEELDDFVVKLAQRSGKGISKRRPQVDATLPDGSRAQLTLGREVSDHGTNYTIRQFKDVPFTPVDLINWNTFSLEEMAFLWLCIENNKSLIFAGGTASGKTTSLNAISLFIPSNTKIVSIEDTREVELPQRNWVASVTRPSFSDDEQGDVDEFDLLEAALRQRPDYIVMGEVRGEEGRDLFQVMSTGHTSYSTFHADTVGEVLKRFTTDPINVSKTMFTALDLVSIQTQTRVDGNKVRRNRVLTEVNHYDAENDEINVQDVYQWQAETDQFIKMGDSNTLSEIKFDRGWDQEQLDLEIFKRETILAYLIDKEISDYVRVAATIQAFINDPDTVLMLIANDQLENALQDLREMESVDIQVDPEKEKLVPRPSPDDETAAEAAGILEEADERIFDELKGKVPTGLGGALEGVADEEADIEVTAETTSPDDLDWSGSADDEVEVTEDEIDELVTDAGETEASVTGSTSSLFDDEGLGFEDDTWGGEGEAEGSEPEAGSATGGEPTPDPDAGGGPDSATGTGTAEEPSTEPDPGSATTDSGSGSGDGPSFFEGDDEPSSSPDEGGDESPESEDGEGTRIFGEDDGEEGSEADEDGDSMESIFGGDEADEDASMFDEGEGDSIFGDEESIFGDDGDDEDEDDDGPDTIFGGGAGGGDR
ncbi:secretion system protein E [Halobacteriales archaeon QS_8_69_26]|nr:MAG: secretion system protein E [Halobacteriales archaeon QS_8_69_26]